MEPLSASKAAQEVGVSVQTVTRAIKKGKLSATPLDGGGYAIDPSELFRVYPLAKVTSDVTPTMAGHATRPEEPIGTGYTLLIEQMQGQIDDLKEDRDAWKRQAELVLLNPPSKVENSPTGGLRGIVRRVWQGKPKDDTTGS